MILHPDEEAALRGERRQVADRRGAPRYGSPERRVADRRDARREEIWHPEDQATEVLDLTARLFGFPAEGMPDDPEARRRIQENAAREIARRSGL